MDDLKESFAKGELPGLHAVVVHFENERIAEAYFDGEDESWGRPLGVVSHGPETLHDVRSITKSVVGLLYGIALEDGLVPPLDAKLLDHFPEYPDLKDGTAREDITIHDTLSLQMGTHWDETLPYSDPRNSEIAMENAKDRYRFVLEQEMVDAPGTKWSYSGGAVALIGKLIADGAGMPLDAFAKQRLFDPLGIKAFEWAQGADGVPSAASGLRLKARDVAKIGDLIANDGAWNGAQIVPSEWLKTSFTPAVQIEPNFHYGLLWYLSEGPGGDRVANALGNGGQRLTVQPGAKFVSVSLAGRYNDWSAWQLGIEVLGYAIQAVNEHQSDQ